MADEKTTTARPRVTWFLVPEKTVYHEVDKNPKNSGQNPLVNKFDRKGCKTIPKYYSFQESPLISKACPQICIQLDSNLLWQLCDAMMS